MGALLEVLVCAKALLVTSHVAIGLAAGLRLAVDDEAVLDVLVLRSVRDRLALLGVLAGASALLVTSHVGVRFAVGLRLAVDDEAVLDVLVLRSVLDHFAVYLVELGLPRFAHAEFVVELRLAVALGGAVGAAGGVLVVVT